MAVLSTVFVVIIFALLGSAVTLAAFYWAVRDGQFSVKQLEEGSYVIFDEEEPVGVGQDMVFLHER